MVKYDSSIEEQNEINSTIKSAQNLDLKHAVAPTSTLEYPETTAVKPSKQSRRKEFENTLLTLKQKNLSPLFISRTIADYVDKRAKTGNTDLWIRVNEQFLIDPTRRKIFVGGFDLMAKDEEMRILFSQFGTVVRIDLLRQPDKRSRGFGFVMYKTEHGARAAVEQKTVVHNNREMRITAAIPEHLKKKRTRGRGRGRGRPMGSG